MNDDRPAVKTTAAIELEKTITYSSKLSVRFSPAMVILEKGKVKLSIKRGELADIYATLCRLEDLEQAEAYFSDLGCSEYLDMRNQAGDLIDAHLGAAEVPGPAAQEADND